MEILIHIKKKKLDSAYTKAVAEYIKRLSAFCRVKCIYYKDFSKLELQNSSACFRVVPGTDTISSEEFAAKIEELGLVIPASSLLLQILQLFMNWISQNFPHSHFPDLQCPLI